MPYALWTCLAREYLAAGKVDLPQMTYNFKTTVVVRKWGVNEVRDRGGNTVEWRKGEEEGRQKLSLLVGTVWISASRSKLRIRSYQFSWRLLSEYVTLGKPLKCLVLGVLIYKAGIITRDTYFRGLGILRAQWFHRWYSSHCCNSASGHNSSPNDVFLLLSY